MIARVRRGSSSKSGMLSLCGNGKESKTHVPFAEITSWTFALSARQIRRREEPMNAMLHGVSAITNSIFTAYQDGSRNCQRVPWIIQTGSMRNSENEKIISINHFNSLIFMGILTNKLLGAYLYSILFSSYIPAFKTIYACTLISYASKLSSTHSIS